jgi:hypothetical protein
VASTAETIKRLIEAELASVADPRVVAHIRSMLVEPHTVIYDCAGGKPGRQCQCWKVLKDPKSIVEIAYDEHGAKFQWGLVGKTTIYDWYSTFLEAFSDSLASAEFPELTGGQS